MSVSENEISDREVPPQEPVFYRFQFREGGQQFTGAGPFPGLIAGTVVMVRTDHGPEPARVTGYSPICGCQQPDSKASYEIDRLAQGVELEKFVNLAESEEVAFQVCNSFHRFSQL